MPTDNSGTASATYLDSVENTERTRVLMLNWSEYLVNEAGVDGALRALTYYENIGWISRDVLEQMTEYVSDMTQTDGENKMVPDGEIIDHLEDTPFELHAGSLQYINDLADDDIEEELLSMYTADNRVDHRRGNR